MPGFRPVDDLSTAATGRKISLKTREVVPRSLCENFRDHGMSVELPLQRVGRSLQKKCGEAYASEARYREMIFEDTGHLPGVGTIPAALERLAAQGECRVEWLYGGGIMPTGEKSFHGTTLVRWANDRHERRAFAKQHAVTNRDPSRRTKKGWGRRHGVYRRPDPRALDRIAQAKRELAKSLERPPSTTTAVDAERMLRDARSRWDAFLESEGATLRPVESKKPPD